ncbi:MAG: peptidoglycan bridge formation glycyltransferase FemA/FemB family protein [Anaerolineales bacterium]|jgi:lipid II:glycine glycyltransferase (peptidoglycan interpeptide bridge formation enzyme)
MLPKNPPQVNPVQWNSAIARLPGAHILQTWEWGKVKSQFGWQANFLNWFRENDQYKISINFHPDHLKQKYLVAAALTLQRTIRVGGFSHRMGVIYVPKGPLLDWNDAPLRRRVLQDLKEFAQKHSAIFIKIDPDLEVGTGIPGQVGADEIQLGVDVGNDLKADGWQFSEEQVQFRNTVLVNLKPSEEELLANMKQKTRYNVNLAMRKGVTIHIGKPTDIDMLIRMYAETSIRDGFVIRNDNYYREVWNTFMSNLQSGYFDQPVAEALIAEVEGESVAGAIIFRFAGRAWYLYGMSRIAHRDKMPNYLLQWEAIKRTRAAGCTVYDLWGAPDEFVETDPLWGVFRFKEGLGGTIHRYLGAWDLPVNRMLYRLYSKTLPGLLDIMRKHGKASTKQVLG